MILKDHTHIETYTQLLPASKPTKHKHAPPPTPPPNPHPRVFFFFFLPSDIPAWSGEREKEADCVTWVDTPFLPATLGWGLLPPLPSFFHQSALMSRKQAFVCWRGCSVAVWWIPAWCCEGSTSDSGGPRLHQPVGYLDVSRANAHAAAITPSLAAGVETPVTHFPFLILQWVSA